MQEIQLFSRNIIHRATKEYEIPAQHLDLLSQLLTHKEGLTPMCLSKIMGVNKTIYNLCAGMIEDGETIEECIQRELYEETGLKLKKIQTILPPSFAAVAISDTTTYIAFAEVDESADLSQDYTSDNEQIDARFYTKEEVKELLAHYEFSSRAQLAAFYFAYGKELNHENIYIRNA